MDQWLWLKHDCENQEYIEGIRCATGRDTNILHVKITDSKIHFVWKKNKGLRFFGWAVSSQFEHGTNQKIKSISLPTHNPHTSFLKNP